MSRYMAYPEYKESNIGWMGAVPEGWSIIPCRAVVKDISDKNVGAADQNYLSVMANVGVIKYEDKGDVGNKKPDDLSKCKIVKAGNLVINSMNYAIGSYGMSPYNGVCSPVYIVLGVNEEAMESRFALRIFENTPFQKYLATFGNGILEHRAAIGWDDIKGAHIAVPSKAEQRAILNFLDHETAKIDALIEKQQRLIELLKEKRQAVISHAVTKGLNSNAPMKDSGVEWLGEVPAHWTITQPRYVCSFVGGGTPSKDNPDYWDGDIPWVSPKDMKVDFISDTQDHISIAAVKNSTVKLIRPGAVLMVVRGMILDHSVPVAVSKVDLTVNQDMKALIPRGGLNEEYFLYCLRGLKDSILDLVESSAHGTKCLRTEQFDRMGIPLPPLTEQLEIVSRLKTKLCQIDDLALNAESLIKLSQARRTAVISAAVTGKIDVRDWQAAT